MAFEIIKNKEFNTLSTYPGKCNSMNWFLIFGIIFGIKVIFFFCDSAPMFFLGDSQAYLETALRGHIPIDRSFVYGFFVRILSISQHSLHPLVFVQVCAGAVSAFLLVYMLVMFFSVSFRVASLAGVLCAVEPIQLMYERYVMTETIALCIFSFFIMFILNYIKRQNVFSLICVQLAGVLLISIRMSYLPLVFIISVGLPIYAACIAFLQYLRAKWGSLGKAAMGPNEIVSVKSILAIMLIHLIISVGATYLLHLGYKNLNGHLSGRGPAYRYDNGFFMFMAWSPIVEPEDFADKKMGKEVFSRLTQNPKDRKKRGAQHYWKGGFTDVITQLVPNRDEASKIAGRATLNAAIRDPLGLVSLYWQGLSDYWNVGFLKGVMQYDRGSTRPLPDQLLKDLAAHFNLQAKDQPYMNTLTNRYYFNAWPWFLFLLFTPVISLFQCVVLRHRHIGKYNLIVFICSSFLVAIAGSFPAVRYFHPLGWLIFITLIPLLYHAVPSASKLKRN